MPGIPGRPQVTDISAKSCKLTWKEPTNDGGTPITGYIVERQIAADGSWSQLNATNATTTELEVKELREDKEYAFRVIAENIVGPGKPSKATDFINPWSKLPTNLHCRPSNLKLCTITHALSYHHTCIG